MQPLARVSTRSRLLFVLAAAVSISLTGFSLAQQRDRAARKLDKVQQQDLQVLVLAVDQAIAGSPAAAGPSMIWQNHYVKAVDQKTFIPFRIAIEQAALATPSVSLYLRAVKRAAAGPAKTDTRTGTNALAAGVVEDAHFLDLRAEAQQPYTITRSLALPAGDYDLYVALKERPRGDVGRDKGAAAPKITVMKQALVVPDYWNGEMSTSSVFVADKVEPLSQPLTEAELVTRPYAFMRRSEIVPAAALRFSKKGNLSVVFQVYNASLDEAKKPNVTADFAFHQKAEAGEKVFNRTDPQVFSANTLQPEFDGSIHPVVAGQEIPLTSFPEGEYRLEITVADRIGNKTLTHNIAFVVTP